MPLISRVDDSLKSHFLGRSSQMISLLSEMCAFPSGGALKCHTLSSVFENCLSNTARNTVVNQRKFNSGDLACSEG